MQGVLSEKDQMWSFSIMSVGRFDEDPDRIDTPRPTVGLLRRWAAARPERPTKHMEREEVGIRDF